MLSKPRMAFSLRAGCEAFKIPSFDSGCGTLRFRTRNFETLRSTCRLIPYPDLLLYIPKPKIGYPRNGAWYEPTGSSPTAIGFGDEGGAQHGWYPVSHLWKCSQLQPHHGPQLFRSPKSLQHQGRPICQTRFKQPPKLGEGRSLGD